MKSACQTNEPFVLRVIGDSMLPDFEDGSIVVIDPGQTATNGDYIVALVANQHQLGKLSISDDVWQIATTSEESRNSLVINRSNVIGRVIKCTDPKRKHQKDFG